MWFDTPVAHIATAGFMVTGMIAAAMVNLLSHDPRMLNAVLTIAIAVAGIPLLLALLQQISRGNFSVDILALLSIVTSLLLHQYWVAAIVVLMLSGGQALEGFATRRASSVLNALAKRMPQTAHRAGLAVKDVPIESIAVGDDLLIYPHEICPVDGMVVTGQGSMDESYLTGEPFLIAKVPGATALSGSINGDVALTIRATRVASDSRYAKIVEVLHASEEDRPQIRRMGDRLGSWYTPLAISIALASWHFSGQPARFLAVLVIATPCPLLISIPVAIIGAISVGARLGIIIKDPSILEKVDTCRTLIVDKTGTLTYGKPMVTSVDCFGETTREAALQYVASLERYSKHPLASAVLAAAAKDHLELLRVEHVSEAPGAGLVGRVDGRKVAITSRGRLSRSDQSTLPPVSPGLECVFLVDDKLAGAIHFQDEPRSESKSFLSHLGRKHLIDKIILLSGDRVPEVAVFAKRMGISQAYGGKSPEEKVALVRQETLQRRTLYIGDGINDAPAMMTATAGIALGVNSDITSEAAGAIVLQSSLVGVDELLHIGRRMRRTALISAVGGMGLSVIGMAAASLGLLTPIQGAIAQEGIDLLSILNSLRMILPTGVLMDFEVPADVAGKPTL
ncbi:heavy metal-(Cd/Co/Hg/Pb/Zn)-translocating P-type ATPase [Terriglobus roseus]|uniref:P-type Zn(2+) transporter n=2 Tax=Terriglobus roseus TaxID=392734 RepID=A0A1H4N290_9BACT|nr:heavy metal-(Cd/Co/Hg/Pb/Zn)-translocating P-type ATPase [Terriglobus roseus]